MRRLIVVLVFAFAFAGFIVLHPVPASAQTSIDCNTAVFDGANVLSSKKSDILKLVDDLSAKGAQVHVVTTSENVKSEDLASRIRGQCSAWRGSGNSLYAPNAIVIIVSTTSRTVTFGWGSKWDNTSFSGRATTIRQDMGKYFGTGDYAQGILTGLSESNAAITSPAPSSNAPSSNQPAQPAPQSAPKSSGSGFPFGMVFGGLLGAIFLAGGVAFIYNATQKKKQDEAGLAEAQNQAKNASSEANALLRSLASTKSELDTAILALSNDVPKDTKDSVSRRFTSLSGELDGLTQDLSDLNRQSGMDPSASLSVGSYQASFQRYGQIVSRGQALRANYSAFEAAVTSLTKDPHAAVSLENAHPKGVGKSIDTLIMEEPREINTFKDISSPKQRQPSFTRRPGRRNQVMDVIEDAQRDVENAFYFIESYWYYVNRRAKRLLEQAKDDLEKALDESRSSSNRIQHAREASSNAQSALIFARQDQAIGRDYRSDSWFYDPWYPWYPGYYPINPLLSPLFIPIPYNTGREIVHESPDSELWVSGSGGGETSSSFARDSEESKHESSSSWATPEPESRHEEPDSRWVTPEPESRHDDPPPTREDDSPSIGSIFGGGGESSGGFDLGGGGGADTGGGGGGESSSSF